MVEVLRYSKTSVRKRATRLNIAEDAIYLQIHLNTLAYLLEYDQSDCGFSRLSMSKYIYECCEERSLYL
jgi:hypothetical protein